MNAANLLPPRHGIWGGELKHDRGACVDHVVRVCVFRGLGRQCLSGDQGRSSHPCMDRVPVILRTLSVDVVFTPTCVDYETITSGETHYDSRQVRSKTRIVQREAGNT